MKKIFGLVLAVGVFFATFSIGRLLERGGYSGPPKPPFTDYRYEKPGTVHKITVSDLPAPSLRSFSINGPSVTDRPKNAWPQAPAGFKVELFASAIACS